MAENDKRIHDPQPDNPQPDAPQGGKPRKRSKVQYSRAVLRRIRLDRTLCAALETHEESVTGKLEELLTPFLEDGERLELQTLQRVLGRLIQDRHDRLTRADEEDQKERDEDFVLRLDRRERAAEVRRLLVELRRTLTSVFGKAQAESFLGLTQHTGRDPLVLQRQGRRVLERLRDTDQPLPDAKLRGIHFDRGDWQKQLDGPVRELERILATLALDDKETERASVHKELELKRHDHEVHWAARWIVAMHSLADPSRKTSHLFPVSRHRKQKPGPRPETDDEHTQSVARGI